MHAPRLVAVLLSALCHVYRRTAVRIGLAPVPRAGPDRHVDREGQPSLAGRAAEGGLEDSDQNAGSVRSRSAAARLHASRTARSTASRGRSAWPWTRPPARSCGSPTSACGKYDRGGDAAPRTTAAATARGPRPPSTTAASTCCTQNLVLHCLDAETGKPVWTKDLMKDHAGRNIAWKSAASPVIDGDLVFVGGGGAGQSLLAINKKTRRGGVEGAGRDDHALDARGGHDPGRAAGDLLPEERPAVGRRPRTARPCGDSPSASTSPPPSRRSCPATSSTARPATTWAAAPAGSTGTATASTAERTLQDPGQPRDRQSLEHAGLQGRLPVRHVQLQEVRHRPAEVRRTGHGQGQVGAAGLRRRQRDPGRRPDRGPDRRRPSWSSSRPTPDGYKEIARAKAITRQVLVHAGAAATAGSTSAAPRKARAWTSADALTTPVAELARVRMHRRRTPNSLRIRLRVVSLGRATTRSRTRKSSDASAAGLRILCEFGYGGFASAATTRSRTRKSSDARASEDPNSLRIRLRCGCACERP